MHIEALDAGALRDLADLSPLAVGATEAHGIYCGLRAFALPDAEQRWLNELFPAAPGAACLSALHQLAAATDAQMAAPTQLIEPWLPAADNVAAQAQAIYDWSRGFLYGLALTDLESDTLSTQEHEIIQDFIALTQLDFSDLDDNETNWQALTEIIEFIRVAVTLIHDNRTTRVG